MRWFTIALLVCIIALAGKTLASQDDYPMLICNCPDRTIEWIPSSLDEQPDTILYDNGTPISFYPQLNYWCRVRFTPPSNFTLHEVYLYLVDGNQSAATCDIYIYGPNGPVAGQALATAVIPSPLPNFGWAQGNLNQPVEFSSGEDFYIVFGPVPGGNMSTTGYKPVLDNGTTTQRSGIKISGGQFGTYTTCSIGDYIVRAGGVLEPYVDINAMNCYNETAGGEASFNVLPGEQIILHTQVKNIGAAAIAAYTVTWSVEGPDGSIVFDETVNATNLAVGATATISTNSNLIVVDDGEYMVSCVVDAPNDISAENNTTFLRFFVGGNHRWYLYDDNEEADSYYSFGSGYGWGVSFTPTEYPAEVSAIRIGTSGSGTADFRIYLNDATGWPTGIPVWSSTPAVVTGWNEIAVDPPIIFFEGETFTVAYLYQTGVNMGIDNDPPNCADNMNMPAIAWQATNNGYLWLADNGGNLCIQAYIDTSSAQLFPIIEASATHLSFGNVTVGTSLAQSFWVYNRGENEDLNIMSYIYPAWLNSSICAFSPSIYSVAPGDSQVVTVTFTPPRTRSYNGGIDVINNSINSPTHHMSISGAGVLCAAPSPVVVDVRGGLPLCECIDACADEELVVCFWPLSINEKPLDVEFSGGCMAMDPPLPGVGCDNIDCPPAYPDTVGEFYYDADLGGWCIVVVAGENGCFCVCLDNVLPVELLSFEAIPGDKQISLHWTTASETDNDYFDIERDGTLMGRVHATNSPTGHTYNWSESDLINGHEYVYSLISVSVSGEREVIGTASATPTMNAATITEYSLHQNYPNPFNPETNISFDIVEAGEVTLTVYNSTGQTVATLVNGAMTSGRHSVTFDASTLPSGLYFYRLNAADFTTVKKMVLMK